MPLFDDTAKALHQLLCSNIRNGNPKLVQLALDTIQQHGEVLNRPLLGDILTGFTDKDSTPIHEVAQQGCVQTLELLLSQIKPASEAKEDNPQTELSSQPVALSVLALVEVRDGSRATPLMRAAQHAQATMVTALTNVHKAEVRLVDLEDQNVFHYLALTKVPADSKDIDTIINTLYEHAPTLIKKPDKKGETPPVTALQQKNVAVFDRLMQKERVVMFGDAEQVRLCLLELDKASTGSFTQQEREVRDRYLTSLSDLPRNKENNEKIRAICRLELSRTITHFRGQDRVDEIKKILKLLKAQITRLTPVNDNAPVITSAVTASFAGNSDISKMGLNADEPTDTLTDRGDEKASAPAVSLEQKSNAKDEPSLLAGWEGLFELVVQLEKEHGASKSGEPNPQNITNEQLQTIIALLLDAGAPAERTVQRMIKYNGDVRAYDHVEVEADVQEHILKVLYDNGKAHPCEMVILVSLLAHPKIKQDIESGRRYYDKNKRSRAKLDLGAICFGERGICRRQEFSHPLVKVLIEYDYLAKLEFPTVKEIGYPLHCFHVGDNDSKDTIDVRAYAKNVFLALFLRERFIMSSSEQEAKKAEEMLAACYKTRGQLPLLERTTSLVHGVFRHMYEPYSDKFNSDQAERGKQSARTALHLLLTVGEEIFYDPCHVEYKSVKAQHEKDPTLAMVEQVFTRRKQRLKQDVENEKARLTALVETALRSKNPNTAQTSSVADTKNDSVANTKSNDAVTRYVKCVDEYSRGKHSRKDIQLRITIRDELLKAIIHEDYDKAWVIIKAGILLTEPAVSVSFMNGDDAQNATCLKAILADSKGFAPVAIDPLAEREREEQCLKAHSEKCDLVVKTRSDHRFEFLSALFDLGIAQIISGYMDDAYEPSAARQQQTQQWQKKFDAGVRQKQAAFSSAQKETHPAQVGPEVSPVSAGSVAAIRPPSSPPLSGTAAALTSSKTQASYSLPTPAPTKAASSKEASAPGNNKT